MTDVAEQQRQAHLTVLNRERRKEELKEVIVELHPLLVDIVDEGTHIVYEAFMHSKKYKDTKTMENLALPMTCYLQLDMLDAMSVMVKEAICLPANLQLRAISESHLFTRFLVQDEGMFEKRAIAYSYEFHRKNIKIGKRLKRFKGIEDDWSEHIQQLKDSGFEGVIEEHKRTKKKFEDKYHGKPYSWYSLYDGPTDNAELIDYVLKHIPENAEGGPESIKILTEVNSQTMHGTDQLLRLGTSEGGSGNLNALRCFNSVKAFITCYGYAAMQTYYSLSILAGRGGNDLERTRQLWINNFSPRIKRLERFEDA